MGAFLQSSRQCFASCRGKLMREVTEAIIGSSLQPFDCLIRLVKQRVRRSNVSCGSVHLLAEPIKMASRLSVSALVSRR